MPDVTGTRTAIATALNAVAGLRDGPADGMQPDRMNLPTCVVQMADDARPMNLTMTDWYDHVEVVLIHSLKGGVKRSDASLSALYDDVVDAINGVAAVVNIERRGYGELEVQGVPVVGAILRLEVIDQ